MTMLSLFLDRNIGFTPFLLTAYLHIYFLHSNGEKSRSICLPFSIVNYSNAARWGYQGNGYRRKNHAATGKQRTVSHSGSLFGSFLPSPPPPPPPFSQPPSPVQQRWGAWLENFPPPPASPWIISSASLSIGH